jgi:allene oxide cyclase
MDAKRTVTVGIAAALVVAVVSAGAGANAASATSQPRSLHLVERGGTFHVVDAPPKGADVFRFSPGDVVIVTRDLYADTGARRGTLRIVCTAVSADVQQCVGSATLPGGTLEFAGLSTPSPTTSVAVTGGTGAYDGARGSTLSVDRTGPADVADLTITLFG